MDAATRDFVRRRAVNRCEYCLLPQEYSELTHHVEHIVAKQHGGSDAVENLALACHRCNLRKGPNLTGIDPLTNHVEALFDPRRDDWASHFALRTVHVEGITPVGRATVNLLAINDPRRLELRGEILMRGRST
jgi:5-methylcytosine-specific restriction endonuclease McrA